MTRTRQSARLSTGGSARRIQPGRPIAAPRGDVTDVQMHVATPALDLKVGIQCVIELL
jgi:hypothetical protein